MTGLAKRFIGLAIGVRTRSRDLHSLASRSYENDCGFSVCLFPFPEIGARSNRVAPPPGEGTDGRRSLTPNLSDGSRRDCPFHSSPLGFLRQCALFATVVAHVMRGIT